MRRVSFSESVLVFSGIMWQLIFKVVLSGQVLGRKTDKQDDINFFTCYELLGLAVIQKNRCFNESCALVRNIGNIYESA